MEERLLQACCDSLAAQIAPRAQIVDAATPARGRCDFLIERVGGAGGRARLVVDLAPERACIYLARPTATGAQTANDIFRRILMGQWIAGIDRPAPRAILRILLKGPGEEEPSVWLVFEWLGARPDALLIDAKRLEVLAHLGEAAGTHAARRAVGAHYAWPEPPHRPFYGAATGDEVRNLLAGIENPAERMRALVRGFSGLPSFLAFEALRGGGVGAVGAGGRDAGAGVNAGASGAIADRLREIAAAPFRPELYIVSDHHGLGLPAAFVSPIALASLAEHRRELEGADFFRLSERAHDACVRAEQRDRVRGSFLHLLAREERRLTRLHARLKAESDEASRAPLIRRKAEALLVHVSEIRRGTDRFACPDPHDPAFTLEIDLDPKLSVSANADLLFRRARRLERGEPLRNRRLSAIDATAARLSLLRGRIESEGPAAARRGPDLLREVLGPFARPEVLEEWKRIGENDPARSSTPASGAGKALASARDSGTVPARRRTSTAVEPRFRPRTYKTREGWTVLVGRSNEENDYVTHVLARPDDYWFHAHGCPGSHVVLRREGRKDNPSVRTIEEAASIAAWFSKARTSKRAPISYTLKKYVRRPRKGPAGLALITREKTILVEPKAPPDADSGGWGDDEGDTPKR